MSANVQVTANRITRHEETGEQEPAIVQYTVDGEAQKTSAKALTAKEIMTAAGVDSKTHYLVQIFGKQEQESYRGRISEEIPMREQQRFVTVSTGPTTVS